MQLNKLMWSKYKTIMNYSNNQILWYIIIYDHILWYIIICYHILSYIIICYHMLSYIIICYDRIHYHLLDYGIWHLGCDSCDHLLGVFPPRQLVFPTTRLLHRWYGRMAVGFDHVGWIPSRERIHGTHLGKGKSSWKGPQGSQEGILQIELEHILVDISCEDKSCTCQVFFCLKFCCLTAQRTGVPTSILGEGQGCQLPQLPWFSWDNL